MVHAERARHDAVLVGAGTARADNPSLTVRGLGTAQHPVRVVVSAKLDLPLSGHLFDSADDPQVWLVHGPDAPSAKLDAWAARGAVCLPVGLGPDGHPDPAQVLQALGQAGLTRVFCEGGGVLAAALLKADLVDDLIGFTAGVILGADGYPSVGPLAYERLDAATRFTLVETCAVGPDVLHRWHRKRSGEAL